MRFVRALISAALIGLAAWALLVAAVYLYSRRDEARPADAIVVLGAAQYDGRPSPVLQARLDHAIALYRQGFAPRMIMTGGVGVGDTVSEAVVGRRYAVKAGVPATAILTERSGVNSEASVRAVASLMESRGLRSALLVSDPFHMLRLRVLARSMNIEAYSSPTRTSPISRDRAQEWRHMIRESISIPVSLLTDSL
jgi:uncharacterized SAM-binding protein YcdF (DUF218 family)